MSIGFLVDAEQPMVWRGPMVTQALTQLLSETQWGALDYLVVDMPPGTGDIQLTLAQRVPVAGAVIVTTPQDIALADARKGLKMFEKVSVPVLGIVENMSVHVCSNCGHAEHIFGAGGGARMAEQYGVRLLGELPLDAHIREEADGGRPTVVAAPDSPRARRTSRWRGARPRALARACARSQQRVSEDRGRRDLNNGAFAHYALAPAARGCDTSSFGRRRFAPANDAGELDEHQVRQLDPTHGARARHDRAVRGRAGARRPTASKIVSYGTSSYGYDVRCASEFKIFTNINSTIVDPKQFDEKSFVDFGGDVCIIPPNSFALARTVEYFRIPRSVLTICLGKCVTGDTRVVDAETGAYVPITEMRFGKTTLGLDGWALKPAKVSAFVPQGTRAVYELRTKTRSAHSRHEQSSLPDIRGLGAAKEPAPRRPYRGGEKHPGVWQDAHT